MLHRALDRVFGIDARSLALFRISIGLILLADLCIRVRSLPEHYSDEGVYPRKAWLEASSTAFELTSTGATAVTPEPGADWLWSLHAMNGRVEFQAGLFALAGAAAMAMIVGWRTRTATFLSWLLLTSLHYRNETICNAGDDLLRVMLFWAMFAPLGCRWAMDCFQQRRREQDLHPSVAPSAPAAAAPPDEFWGNVRGRGGAAVQAPETVSDVESSRPRFSGASRGPSRSPAMTLRESLAETQTSVATACLLLQLAAMYIFSGVYKLNEVWSSGEAMKRAMSFDMYVKPLGVTLRENQAFLNAMSVGVPWAEIILPALCFVPYFTKLWRGLAIVAFLAFHGTIEAALTTGLFPAVSLVCWLLFVPGKWWDVLRVGRRNGDEGAAGSVSALLGSGSAGYGRRPLIWGGRLALAAVFAYVVAWNISAVQKDRKVSPMLAQEHAWFGHVSGLKQAWGMFSDPPTETGYYVIVGTIGAGKTTTGTTIDLMTGDEAKDETTAPVPGTSFRLYPDHRWRRLMASIALDRHRNQRAKIAHAWADRWNRTHKDAVIDWIEMSFVKTGTGPDGQPVTKKHVYFRGPVVGR